MNSRKDFVQVISILSAAVLLSFAAISILTSAVIDPYLHARDEVTNILDFYANNKEENKIYIIGDSLTLCGVDADSLELMLNSSNYSYKVYNIAKNCDTPLLQIIDLTNLIDSKPKVVVIDSSYQWFGERRYNCKNLEMRFSYVADKIKLDNYTKQLFNSTEQSLIQADYLHLLAYKKELLVPGTKFALAKQMRYWNIRNVEFLGSGWPTVFKFKGNKYTEIVNNTKEPNPEFFYKVEEADNDNKKAFRYMVKRMRESSIHVVIVNMPNNPDFRVAPNNSAGIGKESRKNYLDLVTNVGAPYYDLETLCSPIEFQDTSHANLLGQRNITKKMAEILLVEVRNASQWH